MRGYRQDLLLADNGLFASAEVRIPLLRLPKLNGLLQLTPFVNVATVANRDSSVRLNPDTIASVGLGLRLQLSDRLTARFDWGIPLVSVSGGFKLALSGHQAKVLRCSWNPVEARLPCLHTGATETTALKKTSPCVSLL